MKLLELFLVETSEEDRAIISLSSAIWREALKHKPSKDEPDDFGDEFGGDSDDPDVPDYAYEPEEEKVINLGKIGNLVDTPLEILKPIKIKLVSDYSLRKFIQKDWGLDQIPPKDSYRGLWNDNKKEILLNLDMLEDPSLRSAITHELRHALDDYKSSGKVATSNRYWTPKDKAFRGVTKDPYFGNADYQARPGEINARFAETLNSMVPAIERGVKTVPKEELRDYLLQQFREALRHHGILHLFPQKEKSPDYKRLLKRGIDFIQKEVQYQLQKSDK